MNRREKLNCLIADIGGTHSRLAIAHAGHTSAASVYSNREYADPTSLIRDYLATLDTAHRPRVAALAVAGPVIDGCVEMTNLGWRLDSRRLAMALQLDRVALVNDFAAQALAIPATTKNDWVSIGDPVAPGAGAIAVLGPGTGLGVSGLVPCGDNWAVIEGEGGHVTLAARDRTESALIEKALELCGHVSAEHFLSGSGLVDLYRALVALEQQTPIHRDAVAITRAAGNDPLCRKTLDHFFALLGGFSGNLALTLGARGGVYLTGGILPALADQLLSSRFRECFDDKGQFRSYMKTVPTRLVVHEFPSLLGLAYGLHKRCGPFANFELAVD